MNIIDKLHSSITRMIDTAQPSDVSAHRRVCLSASQRANLQAIQADLAEFNEKRSAYKFPSKRLSVLVWHHAGPGKTLEDLPDDIRIGVEKAAFEGNPAAILHQDRLLNERADRIGERAKLAIVDAHKTLLPCLRGELDKVNSILAPIFAKYGCEHEVEDSGPVRRIQRSIADSERCIAGDFTFGADHIPSEFASWL